MEKQLKQDYAECACENLSKLFSNEQISQSPKSLKNAFKKRYKLLTKVQANIDNLSVFYDALILAKEKLVLKYQPVLFVYKENIGRQDKLILAFGGLVLSKILNYHGQYGRIIRGANFNSSKVNIDKLIPSVDNILSEIIHILNGGYIPKIQLNAHCKVCIYNHHCHKTAIANDDLTLLKGLSRKAIIKLNKKGIFSVTQLSYTFRPRKQRKKRKESPFIFNPSLQALAIREGKIYIVKKVDLLRKAPVVYLDIEGIPDRNFYYLIGLHIDNGAFQVDHSFWANNQKEERAIWNRFLNTLSEIDNFIVAHYGNYDRKALNTMYKRYGGNKSLIDKILSSCVNVLSMIYGQIYFPIYSNDLKSLATYLNFKWSIKNPSGLQAIIWRYRWELTNQSKYKKRLVKYNNEDCLALRHIMKKIYMICWSNNLSKSNIPNDATEINDLINGWPYIFKRNDFFLSSFDRINKCAYFDYQRKKIYVRTNPTIKRHLQQQAKRPKKRVKINKIIECSRPKKCPTCSSTKIWIHHPISKTINDLKLIDGGIKRWVVKYSSHRYICSCCKKTFLSKNYPTTTVGHTLRSWVVYQNIDLLHSHNNIVEEMRELFRYEYPWNIASRIKSNAAHFYEQTYNQLLGKIRNGNLIHADETRVSIKGKRGYVWAFTNLSEVVYVYTDTREGTILDQVLDGFEGVLVSDFYSAYDSQPCPQQKCLIHLIRGINDDLFKNPFDEDLKKLANDFTALFVPIIETIDNYGLKKRHLNKHQKSVEIFQHNMANNHYNSEVAEGYQRRFNKYKNKLFTFLLYDGIPWNNNDAENAVKKFVFLRRMIGGSSTKTGIKEYLILLSIRETLRRKNASLFQFLINKETNIDAI
jgi:predicted RecB family nuclease